MPRSVNNVVMTHSRRGVNSTAPALQKPMNAANIRSLTWYSICWGEILYAPSMVTMFTSALGVGVAFGAKPRLWDILLI